MWYVSFLLSLTCHEGAHALAAKWGGDLTAFHQGQVSLNPIPHVRRELFGTVLVPILTYAMGGSMLGWGSAPYDPIWQRRYPRRAAWMALAGPAANFTLVLVAALAIHAGIFGGILKQPESANFTHVVTSAGSVLGDGLAKFLSILFSLNLLLGLFNLLPVPPLDGNTAIGLILPEAIALRVIDFSRNQMFALLGLVLAWRIFDPLFQPLFIMTLNVLYWGAGYGLS